jgi:hypothetical protein
MRQDLFTDDLLEKIKEVYLSPGAGRVKARRPARRLGGRPSG